MTVMRNESDPLAGFRAEIDHIDDALHDLIMRRAEVVLQIAATKSSMAGNAAAPLLAIRPGREAQIMRRLIARHSGVLPAAAIARIWRELIAAKIGMQGPFEVAVYGSSESLAMWDVARSHFGSVTPTSLYPSTAQVLSRVAESKGVIGVLPTPGISGPDGDWWPALAHATISDGADSGVRIIARLPFVRMAARPEPEMVAVATCDREATGDDRSYLLLFCHNEMSRAAVRRLLIEYGIDAEPVDTGKFDKRLMLFDAAGYITEDDPRLARALGAPEKLVERIRVAGGYAVPLQLQS